ncbi:glycosyltransferase family 2 protein [Gemmatimonas phototrophica]|uniref:Glycosyltransferase 2-like domain-containing protein n=1 Tax=Gemmatimonas phototrophica TaxID=1379270 RepID=A0A143BGI3_9BACT|nr:glycosyltransferase family A protein [Gemmatimonas phototrophica]AMW04156.1 hypothetical protein GEMMAAP_03525 [Gemmatimonas phototrophica]
MSSDTPLVSVIIPFRNDEATIISALDSVFQQTWPAVEVLLCDDRSDDRSVELVRERLSQNNRHETQLLLAVGAGAAAARNTAIKAMRGDYAAFLDADDLWFPQKLERCMAELLSREVQVVGHAEEWRREGHPVKVVRYRQLLSPDVPLPLSVYRQNPFSTSAIVVRREALMAAGSFDEKLPSAEDYDYWLRLVLVPGVRVSILDDVLGVYTLREGSESSRVHARHEAMLTIGARYAAIVAAGRLLPKLEHWRYRSRVRLSSGVRFFASGKRVRGLGLVAVALLLWPFRGDVVRHLLARWRSA